MVTKIVMKCICLLLTMIMFVGCSSVTIPDAPVSDTSPSWVADDVGIAIWYGLVPPTLQYNYEQPITRAEFATLATILYERNHGTIQGRMMFVDTYCEFVEKAAYIGLLNDVGTDRFDPDKNITRQRAATILANLAKIVGLQLSSQSAMFIDMDGNNHFNPNGDFTRQEAIVAMLRLQTYAFGAPKDNLIDTEGWGIDEWLDFDDWDIRYLGQSGTTDIAEIVGLSTSIATGFAFVANNEPPIGIHSLSGWNDAPWAPGIVVIPPGGENRIREHHHALGIGGITYEIFLSDDMIRYLSWTLAAADTGLAVWGVVTDVKDLITASNMPGVTPNTATGGFIINDSLSFSAIELVASFIVMVMRSEINRVAHHSNGYGLILTVRVGVVPHLVNDRIEIRSQFIRNTPPIAMMVDRPNVRIYFYPNASTPIDTLPRGTLITAIGGRFDAFTQGVYWWKLDNSTWVQSSQMALAGNARITTTVSPQHSGTLRGGGSLPVGSATTLVATPRPGFIFTGWFENGRLISEESRLAITVPIDGKILEARFRPTLMDLSDLLGMTYNDIAAIYSEIFGQGDGAFRLEQATDSNNQPRWDDFWLWGGWLSFPDVGLTLWLDYSLNDWNRNLLIDPRFAPVTAAISNNPIFHMSGITSLSTFDEIVAVFGRPTHYEPAGWGEWWAHEGKRYFFVSGIQYMVEFNDDGSIHGTHVEMVARTPR